MDTTPTRSSPTPRSRALPVWVRAVAWLAVAVGLITGALLLLAPAMFTGGADPVDAVRALAHRQGARNVAIALVVLVALLTRHRTALGLGLAAWAVVELADSVVALVTVAQPLLAAGTLVLTALYGAAASVLLRDLRTSARW